MVVVCFVSANKTRKEIKLVIIFNFGHLQAWLRTIRMSTTKAHFTRYSHLTISKIPYWALLFQAKYMKVLKHPPKLKNQTRSGQSSYITKVNSFLLSCFIRPCLGQGAHLIWPCWTNKFSQSGTFFWGCLIGMYSTLLGRARGGGNWQTQNWMFEKLG